MLLYQLNETDWQVPWLDVAKASTRYGLYAHAFYCFNPSSLAMIGSVSPESGSTSVDHPDHLREVDSTIFPKLLTCTLRA